MPDNITFMSIPTNWRIPGAWLEIDHTRAVRGLPNMQRRILLLGQRLNTGSVAAGVLTRVTREADGVNYFGRGSMLAQMIPAALKVHPTADLWALALDDLGAGAAATGTITFSGTPTEAGTLNLYIGGKPVRVGITASQTAAAIATAVAAAITALPDLAVTAAAVGAVVTLTAKHKGEEANGIDVRLNYYTGEYTPKGMAAAIVAMSGGTGKAISEAGGTIEKNLPEAISNAVDQTGRLKSELRKAADEFARPINDAFAKAIQFGMDKKENGGLGLSGKEIVVGGTALALGTFAAARYGGKALSGLAGRFGSTAAGVAEGKALETAAGVTPVFVVNWPGSMGGSTIGEIAATAAGGAAGAGTAGKVASRAKSLAVLAGGLPLSAWGSMGAAGLATAGAGVMAAGAGGYAVGTGINKAFIEGTAVGDKIGEGVARVLAFFGNEEARRAVEINDKLKEAKIGGEVRIRIDQEGRVSSLSARSDNRDVPLSIDGGMMMVAP